MSSLVKPGASASNASTPNGEWSFMICTMPPYRAVAVSSRRAASASFTSNSRASCVSLLSGRPRARARRIMSRRRWTWVRIPATRCNSAS